MEKLSEEVISSETSGKKISKIIKELYSTGKKEEAEILALKYYKDNIVVRAQLIRIYAKKEEFEKAKRLLRGYTNNGLINIQKEFLMDQMEKSYKKQYQILLKEYPTYNAKELLEKLKEQPIENIHKFLMNLIENNDEKNALKIARRFKYYYPTRKQLTVQLIERGSFSELVELSSKYPDILRTLNALEEDTKYKKQITTAKEKIEEQKTKKKEITKKTQENN